LLGRFNGLRIAQAAPSQTHVSKPFVPAPVSTTSWRALSNAICGDAIIGCVEGLRIHHGLDWAVPVTAKTNKANAQILLCNFMGASPCRDATPH
jgi:hypothetical protein